MKPRLLISPVLVIAVTAAVAVGCGGDSQAKTPAQSTATPSNAVTIDNFEFSPATLTVTAGTRITVTNDDSTAHTATADDGKSFDTGPIDPGTSRTIAVSKSGSYAYHCSIHPFMKATIVAK